MVIVQLPLILGYKTCHEQYQPDVLLKHAVLAEKYGFETLWTSDHFHPWAHTGAAGGFAWVWMASAAEKTKNMRVGTAVTAPILRYHPAIVAQAFATLAVMYPNRIFLGLGAGEALNESPLGYVWPPPGQRVDMLEEAITVIRKLWTDKFVNFEGKYYRLRNANLYTKPDRPIKIYVAAGGSRVAELAGRLADGLLLGSGNLERSKQLFQAFENGAKKAGRDPSSLEKVVEILVSHDENYEAALKSCRFWASILLPPTIKFNAYDPREMESQGRLIDDESIARRWMIATTAEEHIKGIEQYVKAGFNHLYFVSSSPDETKFIKFYGRNVLPYLRE
ncbi:MAG: TIGR03557 family F420-dependent LLM class oxidoreductase [Crenarchaeota archaeon]|nr:TIGR03557 family F420-dependent LLM class oxidoreductase [Thermoproteota archaeon]